MPSIYSDSAQVSRLISAWFDLRFGDNEQGRELLSAFLADLQYPRGALARNAWAALAHNMPDTDLRNRAVRAQHHLMHQAMDARDRGFVDLVLQSLRSGFGNG